VTNSGPTIMNGSLGGVDRELTERQQYRVRTWPILPQPAAKLAVTAAYNDAAGRTLNAISLPGSSAGSHSPGPV